ncbi:MAG: hypothetical protein JHD35_01105 [Sphingopyxis sp.]|nr:hypothetical protein [Sphingopyxis sp.]
MLELISALALFTSSAAAQDGPFPQSCTYQNVTESDEDGATEVYCTLRYVSTPTGLRHTFRFGGRTVVIDQGSDRRNGLWRSGKIDGRPAVILELWRGSYVATTTDLQVSMEWRDQGSPKYPAN